MQPLKLTMQLNEELNDIIKNKDLQLLYAYIDMMQGTLSEEELLAIAVFLEQNDKDFYDYEEEPN